MSKVEVLRSFEVTGYRIAYYLLKDEELAAKSVTDALLELYKNDAFFVQPCELQQQTAKKMFIKKSIDCIKVALNRSVV